MMQQSMNTETDVEVYEPMSAPSQDVMITEDIYESMLELNPEYADDLCKIYLSIYLSFPSFLLFFFLPNH